MILNYNYEEHPAICLESDSDHTRRVLDRQTQTEAIVQGGASESTQRKTYRQTDTHKHTQTLPLLIV